MTTWVCEMWRKNGLKVSLLAASMACSFTPATTLADDLFAGMPGEAGDFTLAPPSIDEEPADLLETGSIRGGNPPAVAQAAGGDAVAQAHASLVQTTIEPSLSESARAAALMLGHGPESTSGQAGSWGDFSLGLPDLGMPDGATGKGFYIQAGLGWLRPHADRLALAHVPFGPSLGRGAGSSGWSVSGAIGYRISDALRADVSVDYLDLGTSGAAFGQPGRWRTDATLILANLYWDIITIAGFTPYVGGGLGVAITALETNLLLPDGGQKTDFAWSLAAGISHAISENWAMDLGYRYASLGSPEFSGLPALAIDTLGTHEVRVALRYQFGG